MMLSGRRTEEERSYYSRTAIHNELQNQPAPARTREKDYVSIQINKHGVEKEEKRLIYRCSIFYPSNILEITRTTCVAILIYLIVAQEKK